MTTASYPTIEARVEAITPEIASKYLERNTHNRNMRKQKVAAYARDMKAGRWQLTGNAIQFDEHGTLLDGQQRLSAVIRADVTVPMLVVKGILTETQDVLDSGVPRRYYDSLTLRGEKDTRVLGAALSIIYRLTHGLTTLEATTPTYQELDNTLAQHPSLRHSVSWARKCQTLLSMSTGTAFHHLFTEKDADAADEFFIGLSTGTNLSERDPVYVLRERLIGIATDKRRLPPVEIWALVIKAWNAFINHQQMTPIGLRWRSSDPQREPFPTILSHGEQPPKRAKHSPKASQPKEESPDENPLR